MTSTSYYLDTRRAMKNGLYRLFLSVSKNGTRAVTAIDVELKENQWDGRAIINHPQKRFLNQFLETKKSNIDRALMELTMEEKLIGTTAKQALELALLRIDPSYKEKERLEAERKEIERNSLESNFKRFMETKSNIGTKMLYNDTYKKLASFCDSKDTDFKSLPLDSIKKSWLESFQSFCLKTESQNTASRHLRDIRAVFNFAIDEGITDNYPFRKFKIKVAISRDKSFSAQELRDMFNCECYEGGQTEAIEIFKLMFLLIGINPVDLFNALPARKGRLDYTRAKTHKPYSIKLEPEALEIIRKYEGTSHLLNLPERFSNYKTYFNRMGKVLRKVGLKRISGRKSTGKAMLPDLCLGSARTSWATIAQEDLDIPREVIAAALGHSTVDVTTTYLRSKWAKKVDEANRRVIDWVLYEKKF